MTSNDVKKLVADSEKRKVDNEKLKADNEKRKVEHATPELAADKYIEGLMADGTLERASRTGSLPYQLTNGPPSKTAMFVFYQCRYTSRAGIVMDRKGSVIVQQATDGLWYISTLTKVGGIDFDSK